MAESHGATSTPASTAQSGERVVYREVVAQPTTPTPPTKEFRLRKGMTHHVGDAVLGLTKLHGIDGPDSPRVRLTRAQALAFADKFEAVDNTDFAVVQESDGRREGAKPPENVDLAKDTEAGPQGKPLVGPPETVRGATGPAGPALPADITVLDPARQGQPTQEQVNVARAGGASPPTGKVDPKEASSAPQNTGGPATPVTGITPGSKAEGSEGPPKAEIKQTGELGKK